MSWDSPRGSHCGPGCEKGRTLQLQQIPGERKPHLEYEVLWSRFGDWRRGRGTSSSSENQTTAWLQAGQEEIAIKCFPLGKNTMKAVDIASGCLAG